MMLRSSSTPHLGSLLPLFSDSPNNDNNHHHHRQPDKKHKPNTIHGRISRINENLPPPPPQGFRKPTFRSPSPAETKTTAAGFRRVQSEGNLEVLVNASYNDIIDDEFTLSDPKKPAGPGRPSCCRRTLEAIPSFSLGYLGTRSDDNDEESETEDDSNPMRMKNLVSEHVSDYYYGSLRFEDEGKMYLATGLGISGINYVDGYGSGGGGSGGYRAVAFDRDGGGDVRMEDYYRRMLGENPGNALFLRNYAQFLHQKKRDLEGAEEYYSRAILADPKDGEILLQHAKLIWELHHDKERAGIYFERAVQASSSSPDDSHIHAAYASFLWDREDDNDDDEENAEDKFPAGRQFFRHESMASATA
ncbi:hypothetical protein OROMI_015964 [Orobanche minor]